MVCRIGNANTFEPELHGNARKVVVPIDSVGTSDMVGSNVWRTLDANALQPPQHVIDLYRAATAAFTADLRIPRASAFDRWTRDIALHLPVSSAKRWDPVKDTFRDLLSFLTGDHWTVDFHEADVPRPPVERKLFDSATSFDTETVCLLSGGLDSFIGATDALAAGENLMLVSHYAGGTATYAGPAQDAVRGALVEEYGRDRVHHLKFRVDPPKQLTGEWEPTTRSRSIIFLGLGILVASALGERARLLVPENGFISLNVPLTYSRLGTLSTRTTHPHTMNLLRLILSTIGIEVSVENPYLFKTKGEMLAEATNQELVRSAAQVTVSCAHPTAGRFLGGEGSGVGHCGYCVPCIIRRATMAQVGLDPLENYCVDVVGKGSETERSAQDLRAFLIAIERVRDRVSVRDLLRAGPLPADPDDLRKHLTVYCRGLDEVAQLLTSRGIDCQ